MIEVKEIEKSYGNEKVLKGVSLSIRDGEFVSIMGKSGSGKSTLLSILAGFLSYDGGDVLWDGESISEFSDDKKAILRSSDFGFVFQSFKLIPTLNVKDNLLLTATLGKKMNEGTLAYALELAERLGISQMLNKYPDQLSGGQCQRVAIIRALAYKPRVIILDEPTGALDSLMETKVEELLSEINKRDKVTVIQVTHSRKVAEYASRIITLKDGEIENEAVL